MVGRYPDYDVLQEASHWDEATRRVVLDRVENVPPFRFFDERERETVKAFCDTITAQDREPRIPVAAYVDEKLHDGSFDGYRFFDMPNDREVWRLVVRHACEAFYAHPWAWNEIGFGGPAYPRGYSRFGSPHIDTAEREEWEGEQAFSLDPVRDVKERGLE
jgi:hypothetical protein